MADKTKFWIILTNERQQNIWFPDPDKLETYRIEPVDYIRKDDIVYMWSLSDKCFCAWGKIAETPKTETIASIGAPKRREQIVTITDVIEFMPRITAQN